MNGEVFTQNVAKKTYLKLFLVGSGIPIFIFTESWIRGNGSSILNPFLALLVLNGVILGVLKIAFPKRPALKIEDNKFYAFHRGKWVGFNPTHLVLKPGHIRVPIKNRYIAIHFEENEYQRFVACLSKFHDTHAEQ